MLHAVFITPSARQWLAQTQTARVLICFERACNLINQHDNILALVTSERGLTPFAIVIASADPVPFRDITPSSLVQVDRRQGDRLSVGPLQIDLSTATLWDPVPDWPVLRRFFAESPSRLRDLSDMAPELIAKGSLLDLYRMPETSPTREAGLDRAVLERARTGAVALVGGLRSGSIEQAVQGATMLAGLGSGLTPSGDDFIMGTLLAAWAGLFGPGRESMSEAIAAAAAPLTTTLSGAYLRAAARGECIAYWHTMLTALMGPDQEVMRMAAKSLMSIGHSSGADALAGFLAVEKFSGEG